MPEAGGAEASRPGVGDALIFLPTGSRDDDGIDVGLLLDVACGFCISVDCCEIS